jgi:Zn-dependent M28 family amino/carboxypeptidase
MACVRAENYESLETSLRADVRMLAETIGPRSLSSPRTLDSTVGYIVKHFEAAGWQVNRLDYMLGMQRCENLEVEKRGTKFPEEVVIIGAHYDTLPQTPGADDNASGVAAMLALADRLATARPERTLRFVAFANEEPWYFQTAVMGSRVYAHHCKARGDKVVAMLSLETMGYYTDAKKSQKYPFPLSLFFPSRGNFLAIVGNRESGSLVKRVTKVFASTRVLPVESASLPGGLQGVGWSDHWSFWQEGYPAVMVTDTAPFRNPNYHKPTDTPETLNYPRFAAAVCGLEAVITDLVTGENRKK